MTLKVIYKKPSVANLELVNHGFFRIHRLTLLLYQPLGQHPCIELLKYIFVIDVLKDGDTMAKLVIDLTFIQAFGRLFEKCITVSTENGTFHMIIHYKVNMQVL